MYKTKKSAGFTMIELLVVIMIIVMVAALVLPSTVDLVKKRGLKGAASIIQLACLQARSQAISQRENHFVVVFAQSGVGKDANVTVPNPLGGNLTAKNGTVQIFDSNENTPNRNFESISTELLPEFFTIESMGDNPNFNGLVLQFSATGRITVLTGPGIDLPQGSDDVFQNDKADIIIGQDGGEHKALIDIVRNTGQVHFDIRIP